MKGWHSIIGYVHFAGLTGRGFGLRLVAKPGAAEVAEARLST